MVKITTYKLTFQIAVIKPGAWQNVICNAVKIVLII